MTETTTTANWDDDIVALQRSTNIAELLREKDRLESIVYKVDDDEASDRFDNVRDAIDKTIYEDNRIIAVTKWGRPILDRASLEGLVGAIG
jgi:hypothetical protein